MTRVLTSSTTVFHRRLLPVIFAGIVLFEAAAFRAGSWQLWLIPVFSAALFWAAWHWLGEPMADYVALEDGALKVRKGKVQDHIALSRIRTVTSRMYVSPQSIDLEIEGSSPLGSKISFIPLIALSLAAEHPVAKELTGLIGRSFAA